MSLSPKGLKDALNVMGALHITGQWDSWGRGRRLGGGATNIPPPSGDGFQTFLKQHMGGYVWGTLSTLDNIVARTKLYPQ